MGEPLVPAELIGTQKLRGNLQGSYPSEPQGMLVQWTGLAWVTRKTWARSPHILDGGWMTLAHRTEY